MAHYGMLPELRHGAGQGRVTLGPNSYKTLVVQLFWLSRPAMG